MIDPPEGWKYGFPKPVPLDVLGNNEETLTEWLLEQGYPENMIELALQYSRYLEKR
jgi:hypothetical protein